MIEQVLTGVISGIVARPLSEQQTARATLDPLVCYFLVRAVKGHLPQQSSFVSRYKDLPSTQAIVERIEELAKKKGISMAQVAIAWCLNRDGELSYCCSSAVSVSAIANRSNEQMKISQPLLLAPLV